MPDRLPFRLESVSTLRVLGWGALLVPLLLAAIFGAATWERTVDKAHATARENASLIHEYVLRLVQTQDVLLTAADEALRRFQPDGDYGADAHRFLAEVYSRLDMGLGVTLVSPDGDFLVSSVTDPIEGNVGDRAYLRAVREESGLFIDRVMVQPVDVDALVLARPQRGDTFTGAWVSSIEVAVVEEFLRGIAGPDGDAASILREDGRLLVRNIPMDEPVILSRGQPVMQTIASADRGVFQAVAMTDGIVRIYAVERIGNLPLFAIYGVSRPAMIAEWARQFALVAILLGAIGIVGYLLALYAARSVVAEAAQAANAFDRRLLEEAEKTAAAKDTMMRELNHRVKNNLQMVQSLIRLQRHRPAGPDLDEIATRIMAIATIHDLLYQSADSFEVDFAALLARICASEAIAPPESNVTIVHKLEPLTMDASLATPLSLCAIELITNAAKHAYGPAGGEIAVSLEQRGVSAVLSVSDTGAGMHGVAEHRSGLRVVDAFVSQVAGELTMQHNGGTSVRITFPLTQPAHEPVAQAAE